jgi:plasmid stabilization system protein ParE
MEIIIANIAQSEFDDTKQYYELEQAGLGKRFEKEVKAALLRIKQFPDAWPMEREGIQKYLIHKFPYKILYSLQNNTILILAFAHQHREPAYWINHKE